jgi:predicted nucleotidyltransferase
MTDLLDHSCCQKIAELCLRYEVHLLELFGSAARGDFNPDSSDYDFLVAFLPTGKVNAADRYLGLLVDLQDLLGRKVDPVDVRAHRNPFFRAEALRHRVRLYAA